MSELQIFSNPEFGQIRIVEINGKPHAVATDIAKALGYKNTVDAISKHCRWVAKCDIPHPQSPTKSLEVNVIPKGDVYRLAANSELPGAERFESWIFDDVLVSVDEHGGYLTPAKIEEVLSDPDTIIKLATEVKLERQKRLEAEKTNNILMHVNKTYTTTEIAKELGFKSAIALNNDLSEKKIQFKSNDTWVLYSNHADKGYVDIKQEVLDSGRVIYHRRWTQIGREFLLKLYSAEKIA